MGPIFGHINAVFQPYAKLAIDSDHRFITEAHAGHERRVTALNDRMPLVDVQPDAVPRPVR